MTQICAIDNGFYTLKAKSLKKQIDFRSLLQKTEDNNFRNGYILECDGNTYIIGQGKDDIEMDKTSRDHHKLLTLAAIAMIEESSKNEYQLVVALPLKHYKNKEFRENFKAYMMVPPVNSIKLNGEKKSIVIKDCVVFAQTVAALYSNPALFKNKLIGIIDYGGLTISGVVCDGLKPIPESMFTINSGMLILYNKIKSELNERLFLNIQDYEIPYLFKQSTNKEMQKIIDEVVDQHIEDIIRETRAKNWSLETLHLFGTGGGILATKYIITRYFPEMEISKDPVHDNVNGLLNVGLAIWQ